MKRLTGGLDHPKQIYKTLCLRFWKNVPDNFAFHVAIADKLLICLVRIFKPIVVHGAECEEHWCCIEDLLKSLILAPQLLFHLHLAGPLKDVAQDTCDQASLVIEGRRRNGEIDGRIGIGALRWNDKVPDRLALAF